MFLDHENISQDFSQKVLRLWENNCTTLRRRPGCATKSEQPLTHPLLKGFRYVWLVDVGEVQPESRVLSKRKSWQFQIKSHHLGVTLPLLDQDFKKIEKVFR